VVIKNPTITDGGIFNKEGCHATFWNINARKQAINDNLQGSVATYLRCGGAVNNENKEGLLLSLSGRICLNRRIFSKVTNKCKFLATCARCGGIFNNPFTANLPIDSFSEKAVKIG